jgi:hypothetical protein
VARLDQIRCHGVPHNSQPQKCNSHSDFSFALRPEEKREKIALGLDMTSAIKVKQSPP